MPKKAKELSALEVKRLVEPGMHAVGTVPGLHLQVLPSGGRTWVLRVTVGDQPGSGKQRRREVGLGGYPEVTLAMAHEKARAMRDQLKAGVDPVAEKQAARSALRAAAAAVITFEEAAKQYIAAHESGWRNEKHADQWRNTLRVHAEPVLGKLIVSDIQVAHVLKVLEPIWQEKTETATRVRGRIEKILDWAKGRGYRSGDNPAAWKGNQHLPEAYKRNFEVLKTTDPALYKAHRHGDWSAIVGDYFGGVWFADRATFDHHLLPPHLFRDLRLSIDWGSAAPCAIVLGGQLTYDVRLPDDRVMPRDSWVIYDEHFEHDPLNINRGTGRTPGQIAPAVHAMAARSGVRARGVIDSAAEARSAGRQESSISDLWREAGVRVTPAKKGPRVPRMEALKTLMANGEFWVARRCRFWLATVPALPRDPRLPEDVDTSANDHLLDATSYLIAGRAGGQARMGTFDRRPPPMPDTGDRVIYV